MRSSLVPWRRPRLTGHLDAFPGYSAPIIRNGPEGREHIMARRGMPTPPRYMSGTNVDSGVTNIRRTTSSHWRVGFGSERRCLAPFTSFAEDEEQPDCGKSTVWFAFDESRPLAFFAGIWSTWRSGRGSAHAGFFGSLTSAPNAEVAAAHPKAMPVILTAPGEWETGTKTPWAQREGAAAAAGGAD
jgi:putative SOS response-associated peptidase YedK